MRFSTGLVLCGILLVPCSASAQTLDDPALTVQTVVTGIDFPTTMAFIGDDDFLILQKIDGRVRRVTGGVLQAGEVLDVSVDPDIDKGLLGITVDPDFVNNGFVFLFYSEAAIEGQDAIANRVYRYTWNGSQLVDPHLVLDLPNTNRALVGGIVTFGHDDKLYTVMGSLERFNKLQNVAIHADPDDTSVIFRTNTDGSAIPLPSAPSGVPPVETVPAQPETGGQQDQGGGGGGGGGGTAITTSSLCFFSSIGMMPHVDAM